MRHTEQSSSPATALEVSKGSATYASLRSVIQSTAIAALAKAASVKLRAYRVLRAGYFSAGRQEHQIMQTRARIVFSSWFAGLQLREVMIEVLQWARKKGCEYN